VSHTFSPVTDRRTEALAATSGIAAAVAAVIVFFPAEGKILAPVHDALDGLLGGATFSLPVGFTLVGAIALVRRTRPDLRLPKRRLAGLGALTLGLFPAERLLGQPTGFVGGSLTNFLLEAFGPPLTVTLTVAVVLLGIALAFDLKPPRWPVAAR
jgi:hypothetical protein